MFFHRVLTITGIQHQTTTTVSSRLKAQFSFSVQLLKHYRSHERRGDVPGIPAAPPRRRRNADSAADELKEEAEEGGDEAKTLVCDMCAGVFGSEKALSLHLSAHKQDTVCGVEGCQEVYRSARALKEHKVRYICCWK
jgi:hypothetical protein